MGSARIVLKNVGVTFFGDILGSVLSLALVFAIARYLGDVGLGKYSFALAFSSMFILFSDLGTNVLVIKDVSVDKSKAEKYARNMLTLKLLLGGLCFSASVVAIIFSGAPFETVSLVIIASIAMFFNYFCYLFRALFQAFEIFEFDAATKLFEKIMTSGFGLFVLWLGFGVEAVLATQVVSFTLFFLVSFFLVNWKVVPLRFGFDWKFMVNILKLSLPFWLTTLFIYIYARIDIVMLSFITTDFAQVGWYSAAYKLIEALSFIQVGVISAVFPIFSQLYAAKKKEALKEFFSKAFYYLFMIALPLTVGGIMLADRIILFVYGAGFSQAVLSLQILFIALFFIFMNFVMGYLLNASNRGYQFTAVVLFAAVLNILVNLVVLPRFGYIGASWTTVLSELVNFVLFVFLILRFGMVLPIRLLLKPSLCAVIMAGFLVYFAWVPLLLLVPFAGAVYLALLFLLGSVRKDDALLIFGKSSAK